MSAPRGVGKGRHVRTRLGCCLTFRSTPIVYILNSIQFIRRRRGNTELKASWGEMDSVVFHRQEHSHAGKKKEIRSNPSLCEHGVCSHTSALGKAEGQGAESENTAGHLLVMSFFSCSKMDLATLKWLRERCRTPEMEGERAP